LVSLFGDTLRVNNKFMKKSRRLNALQSFLVIAFGSLVGSMALFSVARAAAPFEDDFDSYAVGSLDGQGGWGHYANWPQVQNTISLSAPNSLEINATTLTYKSGDVVDNWEAYVAVYFGADFVDSFQSNTIRWTYGGYGTLLAFRRSGDVISVYADNPQVLIGTIPIETWAVVGVRSGTGTDTAASVNDVWVDLPVSYKGAVNFFQLDGGSVGGTWYIDSISGTYTPAVPPVIAGYAPILTPTLPARNAESIVDLADFTLSGLLEIPTANTHEYHKLIVTFQKPEAFFPAQTYVFDLGDLVGGQSLNYSATTSIPITTSGVNFFKVSYAVTGSTYVGSYADNPPIDEPLLSFDITWIKDAVGSAPAYLITPSIKPAQDALEDCDSYTGIDAVICNFRNFVVGAFLPSDEALAQIGGTMDALKSKFPMNYAAAISGTFATISSGVNDTATFTVSMLGHSGAVDTSFFTQDLGSGITLGATIKLILTFLVFMIFLKWGISYMHRILKK